MFISRLRNNGRTTGDDRVIHYSILTKLKLFKNYLASSGSIELHFTSATSNIQIGRATIPIPMHLIKFIDKHQTDKMPKMRTFRTNCQIFNGQNKTIGNVTLDYDLILCDGPDIDKAFCEIENDVNRMNIVSPKVKILPDKKAKMKKSMEKKSIETPQAPSSVKVSSKNPSPLLDYLTGRSLADHEKYQAIESMVTTSPSESLIDLLSSDLDCLYMEKEQPKINLNNSNQIDSIRTHIYELSLTRAGVREILNENGINHTSYSSGTFIVDINLSSAMESTVYDMGTTFISEVSHVFTSTSDCLPPRKYFFIQFRSYTASILMFHIKINLD